MRLQTFPASPPERFFLDTTKHPANAGCFAIVVIPGLTRNLRGSRLTGRDDTTYTVFIDTSTPAGRFKLIRVSTVRGVDCTMSINRLCTRISYWSRAFLCTNVERFTVYFFFAVGSGVGPATFAPSRSTASIICFADWSINLWSYAFSLIRIFGTAGASTASDCLVSSAINQQFWKQLQLQPFGRLLG